MYYLLCRPKNINDVSEGRSGTGKPAAKSKASPAKATSSMAAVENESFQDNSVEDMAPMNKKAKVAHPIPPPPEPLPPQL